MISIYELSQVDLRTPRRVMKYVVFWVTSGELELEIDGRGFVLKSADMMTITSGQIHRMGSSRAAAGFMLEFTFDFFCKDDKDIELVFENGLFCHFDDNQVISMPEPQAITAHFEAIRKELSNEPYQYLISVHSRLELILVEVNRAKVQRGDEIWKPDALFLKFLELTRASFDANFTIADYAQKLQTTEQKLNEQARLHAGKTAQMVVYGLIASEAKRLLTYESLSVKEIAFRLGFSDPFYFSNFFKKHTGRSPKAWREALA